VGNLYENGSQSVSRSKDMKYDKQDQQGKAASNELHPHATQQQEPVARSPGGAQTKTGQSANKEKR
jgi:hypothetical protein